MCVINQVCLVHTRARENAVLDKCQPPAQHVRSDLPKN